MAFFRIGLGCVGARLRDPINTGSLEPRLLKASRRRWDCGMEPMRRWRNQHLMVSNHNGRQPSLSQITQRPTGVHWPSCTKQIQSNRSTSNSVIKGAQASSRAGSPNKVPSRNFWNNRSSNAGPCDDQRSSAPKSDYCIKGNSFARNIAIPSEAK